MRSAVLVFALCRWVSSADAEGAPGAPGGGSVPIVIEAYRDARPPDADRIVARLRSALERHAFTADPAAVIARLGDRWPTSGLGDPAVTASALAERVDVGFKAALHGHYAIAVTRLEAVLAAACANPAIVVADPRAAQWRGRALVGLAFAHSRLGNTAGAADAMAEHLRSFPDQPVTREEYGPEAEQLYAATKEAVAAIRPGRLVVALDDPSARIYVDEVAWPARERELMPGAYRVLVAANGVTRQYAVTVVSDRVTRLQLDWELDSRFAATRQWVGFAGLGERDPMPRVARTYAAEAVLAIGIESAGGRRLVVGQLHARGTGTLVRRGAIELGAREDVRLQALADYLATGVRTRDLVDESPPAIVRHPRSRWPRWTLIVGGVAALGTGGYLVYLDGRGTCGAPSPVQCPELHRTSALGWSVIAGGAIIAGLGIYASLGAAGSVQLAASPNGAAVLWSY